MSAGPRHARFTPVPRGAARVCLHAGCSVITGHLPPGSPATCWPGIPLRQWQRHERQPEAKTTHPPGRSDRCLAAGAPPRGATRRSPPLLSDRIFLRLCWSCPTIGRVPQPRRRLRDPVAAPANRGFGRGAARSRRSRSAGQRDSQGDTRAGQRGDDPPRSARARGSRRPSRRRGRHRSPEWGIGGGRCWTVRHSSADRRALPPRGLPDTRAQGATWTAANGSNGATMQR